MAEDHPTEKPPFWTSLPGILTASATALGAVTALVTALYTAGIIGQPRTEPKPPPASATQPPAAPQPAADDTAQKIDAAKREEQAAAEALQKARAEADRLRQELAATKQRELEARTRAELEAAKRRAEEAERERLRAEAELDRLRRERDAAAPAPAGTTRPTQDAVLDFKAGVRAGEVSLDVRYTFDPTRKGPVYVYASLLYQGKRIGGLKERPAPLTQPQGTARMLLTVRPDIGRQSDELEVYLIEGRDRFAARRFPFVRTFEIGTAPSPGGAPTPPSALDAIQDYKASVSGNEVTVEVFYSYDSARRGPIYAVVSLLYQGKRIAAPREKPQILTQPAGSVRTPLLVRPNVGRQSDELEVVLFDDKARIASRRFPFARTFDGTP